MHNPLVQKTLGAVLDDAESMLATAVTTRNGRLAVQVHDTVAAFEGVLQRHASRLSLYAFGLLRERRAAVLDRVLLDAFNLVRA